MKITGSTVALIVAVLVTATAVSCKPKDSAGAEAGAGATPKTSAACPYKGSTGFCFTPPAGTTPDENKEKAMVSFERSAPPKPAQVLLVRTEDFELSPETLKSKRDFAKKRTGATVLEDIDIAGGKGFYVAVQTPSNVLVTAIVPDGTKFHECTINVYTKEKDSFKDDLQACKSLKPAS